MAASVFESYYERDWGKEARKVRNDRRRALVKDQGHAGGIVRGRVQHPVFGAGYDLHYRRPMGRGVDDVRVTPKGQFPQTPPSPIETEERWEITPQWEKGQQAWLQ